MPTVRFHQAAFAALLGILVAAIVSITVVYAGTSHFDATTVVPTAYPSDR